MKAHFLGMLAYNKWANDLILDALQALQPVDEQSLKWMNHIVNAEVLWLDRATGVEISVMPWDDRPLAACREAADTIHTRYSNFIQGLSEKELVSNSFSYHNTSGYAFTNTYAEILTHIFNHSTHHRAQISARIRALGAVPPPTDYIFYLRK